MEVRTSFNHPRDKEPVELFEKIFDKLEYAEIEDSPLGVTLLGITRNDIELLKAVFGRKNGFKLSRDEELRPIQVIVETTGYGESPPQQLKAGWYRLISETFTKYLGPTK